MTNVRPCPRCKSSRHFHGVARKHHPKGSTTGYVCSCGYHEVVIRRPGAEPVTVGHPALTLDSADFVHRQIMLRLHRLGKLHA